MTEKERYIMEIWFSQVVLLGCTIDESGDDQERAAWQALIGEPWAEPAAKGWKVGAANDWFRFLLKSVEGPATTRLLVELLKADVVDIGEIWHPELDGLGADEPRWKADFPIEHLVMSDAAREILGIPPRAEWALLDE